MLVCSIMSRRGKIMCPQNQVSRKKCPFWPKKCVPFSDPRFNTNADFQISSGILTPIFFAALKFKEVLLSRSAVSAFLCRLIKALVVICF